MHQMSPIPNVDVINDCFLLCLMVWPDVLIELRWQYRKPEDWAPLQSNSQCCSGGREMTVYWNYRMIITSVCLGLVTGNKWYSNENPMMQQWKMSLLLLTFPLSISKAAHINKIIVALVSVFGLLGIVQHKRKPCICSRMTSNSCHLPLCMNA